MTGSQPPEAEQAGRADPSTSRKSLPKRIWTELGSAGKAIVALIAAAAIGGTAYSLIIQPELEDIIAGESRLDVRVLEPGEFTPRGLPHSGAWIFPAETAQPDEVPSAVVHWSQTDAFNAWATDRGGVAAETLALRLSIRAQDDTPVIIHGLRVEVVERGDSADGWFFYPQAGCGTQPVRTIQFNLDSDPVVPMQLDTGGGEPHPFDQAFSVSRTDPEVFEIHADALDHYVEFKLTLLYDSESGTGEYAVADGKTFAVTGIRPHAEAYQMPYSRHPKPDAKLERTPAYDGGPGYC